jgi:dolichyl-diphosphooligosaccharide--protein glycosyltransferase
MYSSYLNLPLDYVFLGSLVCLCNRTNGSYFLGLYGFVAMHFSGKMNRLVLICGPIVAMVCSVWVGFVLDFLLEPVLLILGKQYPADNGVLAKVDTSAKPDAAASTAAKAKGKESASKGKTGKPENSSKKHRPTKRLNSERDWGLDEWDEEYRPGGIAMLKRAAKIKAVNMLPDDIWQGAGQAWRAWRQDKTVHFGRVGLSIALIFYILFVSDIGHKAARFLAHCDRSAQSMSNPTVMKLKQGRDGKQYIDDDPWQAYKWLSKNTPKDARVAAWWDYGYQITGIGKRTSLADGNTWNHEHIATLGRLLSGSQKSSHNILRHLADYVLIMTGGVNDDLSISTHFARIGNSVFPDHCGDEDPFCYKFNFYDGDRNKPTPMMAKSLVYNLYMHGKGAPGVKGTVAGAHPKLFELVYKSPRDEMRFFKVLNISQESKDWVANASNRICDAPGSWYCVGQYPPALNQFLSKRNSFAQVEDFNKKGEKTAYTKMIEKQRAGGKGGSGDL